MTDHISRRENARRSWPKLRAQRRCNIISMVYISMDALHLWFTVAVTTNTYGPGDVDVFHVRAYSIANDAT